jgi:hypothetical protein
MPENDLNRRDFTRLTLAAFGGTLTGAMVGCDAGPPAPAPAPGTAPGTGLPSALPEGAENFLVGADHVCRGLNTCKDKDKDGENACAGQGDCATISGSCGGTNACKGQGGCGATAGINECKEKGGCQVPLMDEAWTKARAVFEARMTAEGKAYGTAPAPAES